MVNILSLSFGSFVILGLAIVIQESQTMKYGKNFSNPGYMHHVDRHYEGDDTDFLFDEDIQITKKKEPPPPPPPNGPNVNILQFLAPRKSATIITKPKHDDKENLIDEIKRRIQKDEEFFQLLLKEHIDRFQGGNDEPLDLDNDLDISQRLDDEDDTHIITIVDSVAEDIANKDRGAKEVDDGDDEDGLIRKISISVIGPNKSEEDSSSQSQTIIHSKTHLLFCWILIITLINPVLQ